MRSKIMLRITIMTMSFISMKAQVNVGGITAPNSDAMLQVTSTNKGLLLPNVALLATNLAAPLSAHVVGMVVYNTATAGKGSTAVTPGIYVNDGTKWNTYTNKIYYPNAIFNSINCGGTLSGMYNTGVAMNSGNTKVIALTAATAGSFTASTDMQNGVSFTVSGTLSSTGTTNVTMVASGIPTAAVIATYTLTVGGQSCTFTVAFVAPTIVASSIDCTGGALKGTYNSGVAMTGSNTKSVNVTASTAGTNPSFTTASNNGVTFTTAAGTLATGISGILFTASGTPAATGTFGYPVTIGGQTCTFNVTYGIPTAVASSIDCSGGALNGTYNTSVAMTNSNTKSVNVTTSTAGTYAVYTTASNNGVTFTAAASTLATGTSGVVFTASGTPVATGTFGYPVTIGGQTCTFSVTYGTPTAVASSIDCSGGALNGTYNTGVAMTSGNTKSVNVTTSTAGTYAGYTTASNNGVTFTAAASTLANGTSSVAFTASGTRLAIGAFSYSVTIGGQSCSFNVTFGTPTDAIYNALSSASKINYNAATANTWVQITAADFAALGNVQNISDVGTYGATAAQMLDITNNGTTLRSGNSNPYQTTTLNSIGQTQIPHSNYPIAMALASDSYKTSSPMNGIILRLSSTSIQNGYVDVANGNATPVSSSSSLLVNNYYVIKKPVTITSTSAASFIAIYTPFNNQLAVAYPTDTNNPANGTNYQQVGNAYNFNSWSIIPSMNIGLQVLSTPTKQW